MATIDLRPATRDDYEFAFRVHRAAMRPSVERIYGWDEAFQRRYFRIHFDPGRRQIIRWHGVDVGVLSVEERAESFFLAVIEILPAYQRRGIGTTLIRRLQERARKSGLPVTLQVLRSNQARELYERLGFVLTGKTDTHCQMTWSGGAKASRSHPRDSAGRENRTPATGAWQRTDRTATQSRKEES